MAKRTRNTIPGNLTLVDDNIVTNDADATPRKIATKKAATPNGARKDTTNRKGDATAKDDASDAHEAPVAATNGKAKATKKKTAKKATAKGLTMKQLRDEYLLHLQRIQKSAGTTFSYGCDLAVACAFLGEDTKIADLTPDDVRRYYDADVVTKTRGGKPKAPVTIAKMRRVLRLALVWAASEGAIANAPLPMEPTPPRRRKEIAEQQPTASEARS